MCTPLTDREQAQALFAELQARARAQGVPLRAPPPEPTTCCGRGCNGCVWESFYDAAGFWRNDVLAALDENPAP
ncbi:MAG: oxidoreductase [Rhizobacter sp.]|nr:oxidoreductase [Rhizobacter sp.]